MSIPWNSFENSTPIETSDLNLSPISSSNISTKENEITDESTNVEEDQIYTKERYKELIGCNICIYCPDNKEWYYGRVIDITNKKYGENRHIVKY